MMVLHNIKVSEITLAGIEKPEPGRGSAKMPDYFWSNFEDTPKVDRPAEAKRMEEEMMAVLQQMPPPPTTPIAAEPYQVDPELADLLKEIDRAQAAASSSVSLF